MAYLLRIGFSHMCDDVIGDCVDLRIVVADPGDQLGQGCQPGVAGKSLCHCGHDVGHCCADLPILYTAQQTLNKHMSDA